MHNTYKLWFEKNWIKFHHLVAKHAHLIDDVTDIPRNSLANAEYFNNYKFYMITNKLQLQLQQI